MAVNFNLFRFTRATSRENNSLNNNSLLLGRSPSGGGLSLLELHHEPEDAAQPLEFLRDPALSQTPPHRGTTASIEAMPLVHHHHTRSPEIEEEGSSSQRLPPAATRLIMNNSPSSARDSEVQQHLEEVEEPLSPALLDNAASEGFFPQVPWQGDDPAGGLHLQEELLMVTAPQNPLMEDPSVSTDDEENSEDDSVEQQDLVVLNEIESSPALDEGANIREVTISEGQGDDDDDVYIYDAPPPAHPATPAPQQANNLNAPLLRESSPLSFSSLNPSSSFLLPPPPLPPPLVGQPHISSNPHTENQHFIHPSVPGSSSATSSDDFQSGPRKRFKPASQETDEEQDDEDQCCSICFEPWTNAGHHRLCCLKCGHLFGKSCLEKWLKEHNRCSHCTKPARKGDIIVLFAKKVVARDTSELEEAKAKLDQEKLALKKAQEEIGRQLLEIQQWKNENRELRQRLAYLSRPSAVVAQLHNGQHAIKASLPSSSSPSMSLFHTPDDSTADSLSSVSLQVSSNANLTSTSSSLLLSSSTIPIPPTNQLAGSSPLTRHSASSSYLRAGGSGEGQTRMDQFILSTPLSTAHPIVRHSSSGPPNCPFSLVDEIKFNGTCRAMCYDAEKGAFYIAASDSHNRHGFYRVSLFDSHASHPFISCHSDIVHDIACCPRYVLTVSKDRTLSLTSLDSNEEVLRRTLTHVGAKMVCCTDPTRDDCLFVGENDGSVLMYNTRTNASEPPSIVLKMTTPVVALLFLKEVCGGLRGLLCGSLAKGISFVQISSAPHPSTSSSTSSSSSYSSSIRESFSFKHFELTPFRTGNLLSLRGSEDGQRLVAVFRERDADGRPIQRHVVFTLERRSMPLGSSLPFAIDASIVSCVLWEGTTQPRALVVRHPPHTASYALLSAASRLSLWMLNALANEGGVHLPTSWCSPPLDAAGPFLDVCVREGNASSSMHASLRTSGGRGRGDHGTEPRSRTLYCLTASSLCVFAWTY